jgi:hypothetical protein
MTEQFPDANLEGNESVKEKIWREKIEQVGNRHDRAGGEMDRGIIESMVALNIHGIPTEQSCEGHLDHGIPSPWIAIEAVNRPTERYSDQNKIYQEVALKHGISVEELRDGKHEQEWREACIASETSGETETWELWQEKNAELRKQVEELVQKYESQRTEESSSVMSLTPGRGTFRIFTGGEDYKLRGKAIKEFSEAEREAISLRLRDHQAEMQRFTEFLKQKYFATPETED